MTKSVLWKLFIGKRGRSDAGRQQLAHLAASLTKAILHGLVVLTKATGNLGHFHAAIEMEAVDLGTGLRQTAETALDAGDGLMGIDGGLDAVVSLGGGTHAVGMEPLIVEVAIVVGHAVGGHGEDQTGKRLLADDQALIAQQAQKDFLHHVLGQEMTTRTKTAAHKGEQLVAVEAIVAFYEVAVSH